MIFGLYFCDLLKRGKKHLKKLCSGEYLFYLCVAFKGRLLSKEENEGFEAFLTFYTEGSSVNCF
jgi:hypothetical protein